MVTFFLTQASMAIQAQSQAENQVQDALTDTVTVTTGRNVVIASREAASIVPGSSVVVTHTLTNSGNITECFLVSWSMYPPLLDHG
jgi:hypothetical protein